MKNPASAINTPGRWSGKTFFQQRQPDMPTIPQLHSEFPPVADYFCVSCSTDDFDGLVADVLSFLDQFYGAHECPGVYRLMDVPDGSVKYGRRFQVGTIGFSGAVVGYLRSRRQLDPLLMVIAAYPHNVTGLHVAQDYHVPAAPYVRHAYRLGNSRGVFLTRKAVREVSRVARQATYDPLVETGTVYLGKRGASVMLTVYDKRDELLCQLLDALPTANAEWLGLNDAGPLLRYELKLGRNVGCTLRDVSNPLAVFWHHLRDSGLPLAAPDGVPAWSSHAEGFVVVKPPERLPWQQMKLVLEHSPDIARVVQLAAKAGRSGPEMLYQMLKRRGEEVLAAMDKPRTVAQPA